jgi:hypothetical protein
MKNKFKNILLFTLLGISFLGIQDFCRNQTHGFSLGKTISSYPNKGELKLNPDELSSIQEILKQPFHYLKKGYQCYAFVSQDEKYVLKLLNWKPLEAPSWTRHLPRILKISLLEGKRRKKEHDFNSYEIAFNELKEETGLVYLHLEKTEGLDTPICIYDPIKIRHIIPADQIEFILQKKTELFLPFFEKNKNDDEKMFSFFSQLLNVVQNRTKKNIIDSDISLEHNLGVCEGKPILYDVGNLSYKEATSAPLSESLQKELKLVLNWLKINNPKLAGFLSQKIELAEIFNSESEESP